MQHNQLCKMATTTKKQYFEYANPAVVDKLAVMTYGQFKKMNEMYYTEEDEFCSDEELKKKADENSHYNQFTLITELCKEFQKNDYVINTTYDRRGRKEGRRYAKGRSLQNIWAVYRNAIIAESTIDVDMINAHPTILANLCKQKGVEYKQLKKYIDNRDDIINEFDEEDDISSFRIDDLRSYIKTQLFISCINDDRIKKHFPKHKKKKKITYKYWAQFNEEINTIQKRFMDIFKDELKIIKATGRHNNLGGRLMSALGCKYEDILLRRIEENLTVTPSVLMYDGFLINGTDMDQEKLIAECDELTADFGVRWSVKPIKRDIMQYIDNLDVSDNKTLNIVETCPLDVANKLLATLYKDRLYICNEVHYFKSGRGWMNCKTSIERCLVDEITEEEIYITTKDGDIYIGTNLKGWCRDVITYLTSKCPVNDDLMNEIWEKTIRKIYFKNGYYDFNTGLLEPNDMNSFVNITRELSFDRKPEVRKEIYDRVLNPIFTVVEGKDDYETRAQLRDYWLRKMSRVMAGYVEDKEFIIDSGPRNCGKGLLMDMLKFAFEGYVGATNSENFLLKQRNDEEAKKNSFMMEFQFQRAIVCNEVSLKEHGQTTFDGNMLKKVHSGGDYIEMRALYQNKVNVRLQSTIVFNLNDIPSFSPSDTREKLVQFDFCSKFIKGKEKKTFSNIAYMEADDSVKTDFIKRADVRNEFVLMLIDAFKTDAEYPDALKQEQMEDFEEDDDVTHILDLFEITNNPTDIVSNKKMREFIKTEKLTFTFGKIKKLLEGMGCGVSKNKDGRYITKLVIKDKEVAE